MVVMTTTDDINNKSEEKTEMTSDNMVFMSVHVCWCHTWDVSWFVLCILICMQFWCRLMVTSCIYLMPI